MAQGHRRPARHDQTTQVRRLCILEKPRRMAHVDFVPHGIVTTEHFLAAADDASSDHPSAKTRQVVANSSAVSANRGGALAVENFPEESVNFTLTNLLTPCSSMVTP